MVSENQAINIEKDGGHPNGWHSGTIQDPATGEVMQKTWFGANKPSNDQLTGDWQALYYKDGYWYHQNPG